MINLNETQKRIIANKLKKGFNTTNIYQEFCFLSAEVAEAFEAFHKKLPDVGSELADVAIFLMGISELLGISLESEIEKKLAINEKRKYVKVNGAHVKAD